MKLASINTTALLSYATILAQTQEYPIIPHDYWKQQNVIFKEYPTLAGLAKIQGNVILELFIHQSGTPIKVRAISGPPPLRAYAENLLLSLTFSSLPSTPKGPWKCYFDADFQLKERQVIINAVTPDKFKSTVDQRDTGAIQPITIDKFNSDQKIRLSQIKRNLKRNLFYMTMGTKDLQTKCGTVPCPYVVDFPQNTDIEVVYYCTNIKQQDNIITEKEFTPFFIKNGVLVDWGWSCFEKFNVNKIDIKTR